MKLEFSFVLSVRDFLSLGYCVESYILVLTKIQNRDTSG